MMNQSFRGIPIFVTPDVPRRQLSEDVPVSPEFRAEMNAWMRDFFGTTNVLEDGQVITTHYGKNFHMNPRTYAQLQKAQKVSRL